MSSAADLTAVLDASAVLAYLQREQGFEHVREALTGGAAISTVNLAEVHGRLADRGVATEVVVGYLEGLGLLPEAFSREDALVAGSLLPTTRALGLSLADRACIGLGLRLGLPLLTTDRVWESLELGVEIRLVR